MVAKDDVPRAGPVGADPARDSAGAGAPIARRRLDGLHDFHRYAPWRRGPGQPADPSGRGLYGRAILHLEAGPTAAGRRPGQKRSRRWPRTQRRRRHWPARAGQCRDDAMGPVVVAPGHGSEPLASPGTIRSLPEERCQAGRVGHLDAQISEFEIVHRGSPFQWPNRNRHTASACVSITSGSVGSIPVRRRHSGARTKRVGAAPVTR